MGQIPYELDLRDLMDARYPDGWDYYLGQGLGSDAGRAIADGVAQIKTTIPRGRGTIIIPPGKGFFCKTSPGDLSGITLKGPCGSMGSELICGMSVGSFLPWSGAGGCTGGGVQGLSILLDSGLGSTTTIGIMLMGNSQYQPDEARFSDIYMTSVGGKSYWWDCVHMDGSARTVPQGNRVSDWNMVQLFRARNIGAYFSNAVQMSLSNFGTYGGAGIYGNQTIITGGSADVSGILVNSTVSVQAIGANVYINGTRYS